MASGTSVSSFLFSTAHLPRYQSVVIPFSSSYRFRSPAKERTSSKFDGHSQLRTAVNSCFSCWLMASIRSVSALSFWISSALFRPARLMSCSKISIGQSTRLISTEPLAVPQCSSAVIADLTSAGSAGKWIGTSESFSPLEMYNTIIPFPPSAVPAPAETVPLVRLIHIDLRPSLCSSPPVRTLR